MRRGAQRGLVDHIGQVGAAEARRTASQHVQIGVVGDRDLFDVDAKDFLSATHVGQAHHHAAVEASGTQAAPGPARRDGWWQPPESRRRWIQSRPSQPATG